MQFVRTSPVLCALIWSFFANFSRQLDKLCRSVQIYNLTETIVIKESRNSGFDAKFISIPCFIVGKILINMSLYFILRPSSQSLFLRALTRRSAHIHLHSSYLPFEDGPSVSRQMYTPNQANWKMDRNQSKSTKPHLVLHKFYSRIENWRTKKILTDLKDVITQFKNAQKK